MRYPDRFGVSDMLQDGSVQQRVALALLKYAYWFSPGYIWMLKKSEMATDSGAAGR